MEVNCTVPSPSIRVPCLNNVFTLAKVSAITLATTTHNSDTLVLTLATLGGVVEIGSFPFVVAPPKVAKACTVVKVP